MATDQCQGPGLDGGGLEGIGSGRVEENVTGSGQVGLFSNWTRFGPSWHRVGTSLVHSYIISVLL